MTEAQFILAAASILLSIALSRLLDTTYYNIVLGGDWILSLWLVNRLLAVLLIFWAYRMLLNNNFDIGFKEFLMVLTPPFFLILQTLALTSDNISSDSRFGDNFAKRKKYFAIFAVIGAVSNAVVGDHFGVPVPTSVFSINCVIFAAVHFASSRPVHIGLAVSNTAIITLALGRPLILNL